MNPIVLRRVMIWTLVEVEKREGDHSTVPEEVLRGWRCGYTTVLIMLRGNLPYQLGLVWCDDNHKGKKSTVPIRSLSLVTCRPLPVLGSLAVACY